ncbi:GNAT family N-acetyltransferase [Candidatus Marsarchaeota archaeon]|nr:GNAT family N-acetyltransferase [Candidatus Marsarchaeota archaeon]MCL5404521.1 GNAT family N-acetyltransferase [Candidatus Marsarchaeota archaeon]
MAALEDGNIRLRPVNLKEDMGYFLEWYANPDVLFYSEGPKAMPYGPEVIERMNKELSEIGEAYVIEINENGSWKPIGDASITKEKTPITIGAEEYWGRGIGTRVLALLIKRAREIGMERLKVSGINEYNARSIKLYSRAGFVETGRAKENGYESIRMELTL